MEQSPQATTEGASYFVFLSGLMDIYSYDNNILGKCKVSHTEFQNTVQNNCEPIL